MDFGFRDFELQKECQRYVPWNFRHRKRDGFTCAYSSLLETKYGLISNFFCSQTCRGGPSEGGLREIPNVTGLHLHWATLGRNAPELEIRQKNNQKTQVVSFLGEFAKFGFRVLHLGFHILDFGVLNFGF